MATTTKPNLLLRLILAAVTSAGVSTSWAFAEQSFADPMELTSVTSESDASERLEVVSRLRTLSQQIAAASCTYASGVVPDQARDILAQAKQDFDRYFIALRDGDPELGVLVAETDRRILHDIAKIEEEWALIATAVIALLDDPTNLDQAKFIDDHNLVLLDLTNQLASDVKGHYANPFQVSARDSMMIELAGRQLMLTQKMAKDSCEIWIGYNVDEARDDLNKTMEIFGASLQALRFGLAANGIPAAPNEVIAADLDELLARWSVIESNLQAQLGGAQLEDEQRGLIFLEFQHELADLKKLLAHYREHAERNI